MLDISAELSPESLICYDFVISSEVFEHVVPLVGRAFRNVFRMLKRGGVFLLTAPFGSPPETIEHFPELYHFKVEDRQGGLTLTNVTQTGTTQRFDKLIFHGGPGTTLEMRVFAEEDLKRQLAAAGFTQIKVHRQPCFKYGIWWPENWSLPISARRPAEANPASSRRGGGVG